MGVSPSDINYRVRLRPSRAAIAFVIASGCATLILVLAIPLPAVARSFAAAWSAATWLTALRAVGPRGICEIVMRGPEIDVRDSQGRWHAGHVTGGSFVSPWLTIVRWRAAGARFDRTIVILPDCLDRERFRALRVVLRGAV